METSTYALISSCLGVTWLPMRVARRPRVEAKSRRRWQGAHTCDALNEHRCARFMIMGVSWPSPSDGLPGEARGEVRRMAAASTHPGRSKQTQMYLFWRVRV
jgi:hypothetical protein